MDESHATKPRKTGPTRSQMLEVLKHCTGGLHKGPEGEMTSFDSKGTYATDNHYDEETPDFELRTLDKEDVDWAKRVLDERGLESTEDLDGLEDDDEIGEDGVEILEMVLEGCEAGVEYANTDGDWCDYDDLVSDALDDDEYLEEWDDKSDRELEKYYRDVLSQQGASGAQDAKNAE